MILSYSHSLICPATFLASDLTFLEPLLFVCAQQVALSLIQDKTIIWPDPANVSRGLLMRVTLLSFMLAGLSTWFSLCFCLPVSYAGSTANDFSWTAYQAFVR